MNPTDNHNTTPSGMIARRPGGRVLLHPDAGRNADGSLKRNRGRRSKLTPEVQKRICDALRDGNYVYAACAAGGISEETYYRWIETGEAAQTGPYYDFAVATREAITDAEMELVAMWKSHMPSTWIAVAAFMERRYPERWGRKDQLRHEINGKVDVSSEHRIAIIHQVLEDPVAGPALSKRIAEHFRQRTRESAGQEGL